MVGEKSYPPQKDVQFEKKKHILYTILDVWDEI